MLGELREFVGEHPNLSAVSFVSLVTVLLMHDLVFATDTILFTRRGRLMDLVQQYYPWRTFFHSHLASGTIPFWNRYTFLGMPFFSNMQVAVFYPLNLVLFLLPVDVAFNLGFVVLIWLSGMGVYLLLGEYGLSYPARVLGAVSFMFGDAIFNRLIPGHYPVLSALVLVPFVFLLFERALDRRSVFYAGLAGAVVGFQMLSGHIQGAYNTVLFVVFYAVARTYVEMRPLDGGFDGLLRNEHLRSLVRTLGLSGTVALLISGIQSVPTGYFLQFSTRTVLPTSEAVIKSMSVPKMTMLLLPDFLYMGSIWEWTFYVGVPALLLSLVSLRTWRRNRPVPIYVAIGGIALLLSLGPLLPIYPIYLELVPLADLFRKPARFVVFASFSIAVLGAFGFESVFEDEEPLGRLYTALFALVVAGELALLAVAVALRDVFTSPDPSGLLPSLIRRVSGSGELPGGEVITTIVELMVRDAIVALVVTVATLLVIYLARRPDVSRRHVRTLGYVLVVLATVNLLFYQLPVIETESVDTVYESDIGETNGRVLVNDMKIDTVHGEARSSLLNEETNTVHGIEAAGGYNPLNLAASFETMRSLNGSVSENEELVDVLNVSVVAVDNRTSLPGYEYRGEAGNATLYTNTDSMNKAFFVPASTDGGTIDVTELRPSENGENLVLTGGPNRYEVTRSFDQEGYLVVSYSWYPQWSATVDGRAAQVYRTESGVMAIPIDAGTEQVTLTYQPSLLWIGGALSLAGVALVVVLYLYERRRGEGRSV